MPRLSDDQLAEVETQLAEGPRANGFPTDLWTLARVAEVIERVTGVRYSTTQTGTLVARAISDTLNDTPNPTYPLTDIQRELSTHRSAAVRTSIARGHPRPAA